MRSFFLRRPFGRLIAASLFLIISVACLCHAAAGEISRPAWSLFGEDKEKGGSGAGLRFIGDIYQELAPAVVCVSARSSAGEGSGTGFIIRPDGYIITNYHVIADASELTVSLLDGRTAAASVIGTRQEGDLALIKVDMAELPVAPLGKSASLRVGDVVFPIGNPGGEQFARSMTMGLISGIDRKLILADGNLYTLLQTDAAINPGNSGGPLVDCSGRVVGVNSVKIVDAEFEGMGFAIPIDAVRDFLQDAAPDLLPE